QPSIAAPCKRAGREGEQMTATEGRLLSGTREIALSGILNRAQRAARGFTELGVGAGDSVALVLRNDFPFFEASFATQQLGAYSVPVNWHSKTPEIAYVLKDCGAKAVIAHACLLPQVIPAMPQGVPLFVVPTPPEIAKAYGVPADAC